MANMTKFNDGTTTYDIKDANALPKSGGALTGDVTTSVTEFTDTSLITKSYVDNAIAAITDYESEVFPNG